MRKETKHPVILLAAPYSTDREEMCLQLKEAGFDVLTATNGMETIETAIENPPHIILLASDFSDYPGHEVCRRLKESSTFSGGVTVLMLSTNSEEQNPHPQSNGSGFDGYLTRPIEPDVFIATVNAYVRKQRAEDENQELLAMGREARRDADQARRHLAFLVDASEILGSSLDYETTLTSVARLTVPEISDWCAVDMLNDEGVIERLAVAHVDPNKIALARDLMKRYPSPPDGNTGVSKVLRTGNAEYYPVITDDMLVAAARDDDHLKLLREIGFSSAMIVPITVNRQTIGAITFVQAESQRHYTEDDLTLARDLARRAAVAVENARLYHNVNTQREQLQVTLSSIGDAVIATDAQGRISFMNPVAEMLTGFTQREALHRSLSEVFTIANEETGDSVEPPVSEVLRGGFTLGLKNHTVLIRKDGSVIPIEDTAAPIKDRNGNISGVIMVFHDMSERKRSEQKLRQRLEDLQTVYHLSTSVSRAEGLDQIYRATLDGLEATLEVKRASILLRDDDGVVRCKAWRGVSDRFRRDAQDSLPWAIDTVDPHPLLLEDVTEMEKSPLRSALIDEKVVGMAILPLVYRDQVLGALMLYYDTPPEFDPEEVRLARTLAAHVALAVERVRSETSLRNSEMLNRAVLDSMSAHISVVDAGGKIIAVNNAWEKFARSNGGDPAVSAGVGRNYLEICNFAEGDFSEGAKEVCSGLKRVLEGSLHDFTLEYPCHSEEERRWFMLTITPLTGSHGGAVISHLNITERKEAEEEIKRLLKEVQLQRERLDNLIASVPGVVWEAWGEPDAEKQRIDYVSDYVEEMIGYSVGEWLDTPNFWLNIVHPDDKVDAARRARETFDGKGSGINPFRWITREGRPVWVESRSTVIRDAEGNPVGMRGVTLDITDRIRAEHDYRKLTEELEQRVRERTEELQAANAELEAFSYSVSHDLRAPLRSIDGFSKALLEDYENEVDDIGKDFLRRVRAASQRMARLIDGLLLLSRVTRSEMHREQVNLSEIAREVAGDLHAEMPNQNVDLRIQENLTVQGDSRLLHIVMQNLLGNAWKFSGKKECPVVEFGTVDMENREKPVYYVRDNGAGFNMEYASKLFVPFQRLHAVNEFQGTGIGLATVYRIVRRHGGQIWAESEPEKGATFYFML